LKKSNHTLKETRRINEYIIIETERRNIVAIPDVEIRHDMSVIVTKLLKPEDNDDFIVEIELYTSMDYIDTIHIMSNISYYSEADADKYAVSVEVDESGCVTRVLVYTNDKDTAYQIEHFVNNEAQNSSSFVCRNFKSARVKVKPKEMSFASRHGVNYFLFFFLSFFLLSTVSFTI